MSIKQLDIENLRLDNIIITNASVESGDIQIHNETIAGTQELIAQFSIKIASNVIESKLKLTLDVDILPKVTDEKNTSPRAHFEIDYYFFVPNLSEFIDKTETDIFLDPSVAATLGNIAYSTARGIVFTRCQGTPLKKIIIPILPTEKIKSLFDRPQ